MSAAESPPFRPDPPYDLAAEMACLGAMMLDARVLEDPNCRLVEDDFHPDRNRAVFRAIRSLRDRGSAVDLLTVADELARTKILEAAGGLARLDDLLRAVPAVAHAGDYAKIVRSHAIARQLRWAVESRPNHRMTPAEIRERLAEVEAKFPPLGDGDELDGLIVRTLAEIEPTPLAWLWEGRFPLGKLSVVAGLPGLGKSFFTVDLAARVSRGAPWPDGRGAAPRGQVLFLNAEDDPADTVRPRVEHAGGDLSQVSVIEAVRERPGVERGFDLARDLPRLEAALLRRPDAKLVVIDPVNAHLGKTDSHREADVRGVLAPLARLAAEYGPAVLLVSHLNKSSGASAMARVTGSFAFVGAARAGWLLTDDPEGRGEGADETAKPRRLLLPLKNNLAPDTGGLAFAVTGGPPRVVWEDGPVSLTADEALDGRRRDGGRLENDCVRWVRETLEGAGGQLGSRELNDRAEAAGFSPGQVRRASAKLNVTRVKDGYEGGWTCALPAAETAVAAPDGREGAEGAGIPGGGAFDAFGGGAAPDHTAPPLDPFSKRPEPPKPR